MTNADIKAALEWRYATKRFDANKKISDGDWKTLTEALVLAPSSYGLQPWKFLVVQNKEIREKLKPASWNQTQVTDASHYVVFAHREKMAEQDVENFIKRVADVRGAPLDTLAGYKDMMIGDVVKGPRSQIAGFWTQRQAYIAMGFLLETAALLKIDACPMEGFDPSAYDKILGLEGTGWKSVASVALGYRHPEDGYQSLKKVRFEESTVIQYVK